MIRIFCDRHLTRIGTSDGLSLKLKAGALPDGRICLDFCEECRAEFLAWLGDRAATLPSAPATTNGATVH